MEEKNYVQNVISIYGGVADIAYVSEGVEVAIVDFDNAEAEGKNGDYLLRKAIRQAKKDEKQKNG